PDEKEIRLLELAEDPSGKYLGLPHRVKTWYKDASQPVKDYMRTTTSQTKEPPWSSRVVRHQLCISRLRFLYCNC
ncbi:hypothetical protein V3C99_008911, partial [Haemonchus contortus]